MKYYLIAGEASGDLHGAYLMRALRQADPAAEFRFWGGDMMAAEGGQPVRHISQLSIMGFVEVVAHLRTVLGNIALCKQDIAQFHPDVVVGIDYPGFNFKIEKWAHAEGYRTVHYISPNLWAWKKGRLKGMRQWLDRLCFILPFEQRFFAENNMPQAEYVGHPLLDEVQEGQWNSHSLASSDTRPIVALLPGSRRQELKNSLPHMVRLAQQHPEYRFVVAGMTLLGEAAYSSYTSSVENVEVVFDQTYSLLSQSYAAVVCSGTATLETALFDVPQVVCYSGNPLSYVIARAVVGRRIRYISLVNLIADADVVTELIQNDFNPARLEQEFEAITRNAANRRRMQDQYAQVRSLLGDGGAASRTASSILSLCS